MADRCLWCDRPTCSARSCPLQPVCYKCFLHSRTVVLHPGKECHIPDAAVKGVYEFWHASDLPCRRAILDGHLREGYHEFIVKYRDGHIAHGTVPFDSALSGAAVARYLQLPFCPPRSASRTAPFTRSDVPSQNVLRTEYNRTDSSVPPRQSAWSRPLQTTAVQRGDTWPMSGMVVIPESRYQQLLNLENRQFPINIDAAPAPASKVAQNRTVPSSRPSRPDPRPPRTDPPSYPGNSHPAPQRASPERKKSVTNTEWQQVTYRRKRNRSKPQDSHSPSPSASRTAKARTVRTVRSEQGFQPPNPTADLKLLNDVEAAFLGSSRTHKKADLTQECTDTLKELCLEHGVEYFETQPARLFQVIRGHLNDCHCAVDLMAADEEEEEEDEEDFRSAGE